MCSFFRLLKKDLATALFHQLPNSIACYEGGPDQPEEPGILERTIGYGVAEPIVVFKGKLQEADTSSGFKIGCYPLSTKSW